ncbi:hypothetical protein L6164_020321 [Bauhinia variegata]|uniref:Uncharacterized protein n=1 Tax=Bauhinia variegata TaxID=167791 RepID=A0ACB9MUQ4_BAUVA|nr:hypothetical protein L6164_020321 [Bauhinia variegata]
MFTDGKSERKGARVWWSNILWKTSDQDFQTLKLDKAGIALEHLIRLMRNPSGPFVHRVGNWFATAIFAPAARNEWLGGFSSLRRIRSRLASTESETAVKVCMDFMISRWILRRSQ